MLCAAGELWDPTHRKSLEISFDEYSGWGDWAPAPGFGSGRARSVWSARPTFLQALLRLERHDERPVPQAPPLAFASEGTIDVVLMLGLYSDLHEPCFLMWESGRGSGTSACGQVGVPRRPRSRRTSMSPHRGFRMGLSGGSCSSGRVRGHGSTERRGGIHLR
jgi:hypothetical protein